MWARIARFDGDPADVDARISRLRAFLDSGEMPAVFENAKFLMSMLLRHLREQFFTLAEIQIPEGNDEGKKLLTVLGFNQTDTSRRYLRA